MKKLLNKITGLLLAVITMLTCFGAIACGGSSKEQEAVNEEKTQIYIGNNNFGFGDQWLIAAKDAFEKEFAETSFEEGKKGVQVMFTNGSDYGSNTLLQSIDTKACDIIFGENTSYFDFVKGDAMLDITDIVTETLSQYSETRSIKDKLSDCYADYLNIDGHYYGLPNYECTYWITYNINFFDANSLYFKSNGKLGAKLDDADKSVGPDGQKNTSDDGLPATFEEFFTLCDEIKVKGNIPITWPGGIDSYRNVYLSQICASVEGKEQWELGYNFNGKAKHIVSGWNGDEPILSEVDITTSNYPEIYKQAGRYYALNFFEKILENGYCSSGSTGSRSHLDNQADFINSEYNGEETMAMLFDGNYWTNEASDAFDQAIADYGDRASKENARYGVLPIPKPTADAIWQGKNSYMVGGNDLAFIYKRTPENRIKACKTFLQWLYSDKQLKKYTAIVGTSRGCDIEYTQSELNALPVYTQKSLQLRNESDLSIAGSKNDLYKNHMTDFSYITNGMSATLDTDLNDGIMYLRGKNDKKVNSAKDYFEGIYSYYNAHKIS